MATKYDIFEDCHTGVCTLTKLHQDEAPDDVKEYFSNNSLDIDNLYEDKDALICHFFYIVEGAGVCVEIMHLDVPLLEMIQLSRRVEELFKHQAKALSEGRYFSYFALLPKKVRYREFLRIYKSIDVSQVYEVFKDIYISVSYGFAEWDKSVIEYCFGNAPKYSDSDEYVTVYRGSASKSTPLKDAYSWTLSLGVAMRFVPESMDSEMAIHRARVKKCNIIDILSDRAEEEVLCRYEDLEDVEQITDKFSKPFLEYCYVNAKAQFDALSEGVSFNTSSLHGKLHALRVFILSNMLSDELMIDDDDKEILLQCAMLHDIGRRNDSECTKHGKLSVEKCKAEKYNPFQLNKEDSKICYKIMERHCLADDVAFDGLNERESLLLSVFKDCDALDRVRLYDLDEKYLRHKESIRFLVYALVVFHASRYAH